MCQWYHFWYLKNVIHDFAGKLILSGVFRKANSTCKLSQADTDQNIQKWLQEVSFAIDHDLGMFEKGR